MQSQPLKPSASSEAALQASQQVVQASTAQQLSQSLQRTCPTNGNAVSSILPPGIQQAASASSSPAQPKVKASQDSSKQRGVAKGRGQSALQLRPPAVLAPIAPAVPLGNFPNASIPPVNNMYVSGSKVAKPNADKESTGSVTPTPEIFRGCKLRSGKWLPEEERYAQLLIGLFEKGHIMDCENGATLRAFLSQKLHCAPMRISKKFAGQGIGKMVYLSKVQHGIGVSRAEQERIAKAIKAAEGKFHLAVFQGRDFFQPQLHSLGFQTSGTVNIPLVAGLVPVVPQPQLPFSLPNFPTGSCTATTTTTMPPPKSVPGSLPPMLAPRQQPPQPSHQSATATILEQTNQLHKSYINALMQLANQSSQTPLAPKPEAKAPNASPSTTTSLNKSSTAPAAGLNNPAPGKPTVPVPKVTLPNDKTPHGAPAPTPSTITEPVAPDVTAKAGVTQGGNVRAQKETVPLQKQPPSLDAGSDLPDFLSGFDKVALSMKALEDTKTPNEANANVGTLTDTSVAYSPPFTSRSFDDFHRFLGGDLKTLDETIQQRTHSDTHSDFGPQNTASTDTTAPLTAAPDTTALFSAESYAMFAQESALAASQHDAYLPRAVHHNRSDTMDTLDVSDMIKLVSEHVSVQQTSQAEPLSEQVKQAISSAEHGPQQTKRPLDQVEGEATKGMTPVERLFGSQHFTGAVVSSTEPSSAADTDSSALGSYGGSISESHGSDCTSSSSEESSNWDSYSDFGPQRKKARSASADGDTQVHLS